MEVKRLNRKETGLFSEQHLRMVYHQEQLETYIQAPFEKRSFGKQIDARGSQFSGEQRAVLTRSLLAQYKGVEHAGASLKNIELLNRENTFTVTTGHQLSLFAGPLFFVVKVLQVIRLSEALSEWYPKFNFVPVFWMASEDHDAEEVQSVNLFNRSLTFDYEQRGAAGHFSLEHFEPFRASLRELFSQNEIAEVKAAIESYKGHSLAEATRNLVHYLFGQYGLVIVDGDDADLKRRFLPIMKKEVKTHFSHKAVNRTSELLEQEGLKRQVHAREINLFYLGEGSRDRIIRQGKEYHAGDKKWSEQDLYKEMEVHPQAFSPNVILRPVYQECILPNLSYTGGAGEISYWLQLREVFEEAGVLFPLIQVRNSVLWIEKGVRKKMEKVGLALTDLFTPADQLKKAYIKQKHQKALDFGELALRKKALVAEIRQLILGADANLEGFFHAESRKIEKQLEMIQSRLIKVLKEKDDQAMKDIDFVKGRLFPNGTMQERVVSFFSFCADGSVFNRLEFLKGAIDPFGGDFFVLMDELK